MSNLVRVVTFIPRKAKSINIALESPLGIKEKFFAMETYMTKLFGDTTGF
jgi:hypothetical protein